ncbi:hypothetical protein NMY22_g14036 [Coprinellus aureogranulatus]|nr:hypothetical protein NMY22_g14036 [Coprinellus aureogranulatus]
MKLILTTANQTLHLQQQIQSLLSQVAAPPLTSGFAPTLLQVLQQLPNASGLATTTIPTPAQQSMQQLERLLQAIQGGATIPADGGGETGSNGVAQSQAKAAQQVQQPQATPNELEETPGDTKEQPSGSKPTDEDGSAELPKEVRKCNVWPNGTYERDPIPKAEALRGWGTGNWRRLSMLTLSSPVSPWHYTTTGALLSHIPCTARIFFENRMDEDGTVWRYCSYEGFHEHPRPPGGRLTEKQRSFLDRQVRNNPDVSTFGMRTGDAARGITPLGTINPKMASPSKASYEHQRSKERLGITPGPSGGRGAFAFLEGFYELQQELPEPFIVNSSLHAGNIFIVMQTPFMASLVHDAVHCDPTDIEGREGFNTDGDNTFFKKGALLATVVFHAVLESWVPVLFTWILRQDTTHHRAHFQYLFRQVVRELKAADRPLVPRDLINVVDFSVSQREAFILEYIEACISMVPNWDQLQPESQAAERAAFRKVAEGALLGCSVHFKRSALRIKKQGHLVEPVHAPEFDRFIYKAISEDLTKAEFDILVQGVREMFPKIKNWLDWWVRPAIASMIFPACSVVDRALAARVPGTTNPVESSHSLLHHAVGSGYDPVEGFRRLYEYMNEPRLRLLSHQGGHSKPAAPKTPGKKKAPRNFEPGDGRAPDTLEMLGLNRPSRNLDSVLSSELFSISYLWSNYSCFIDHTVEVLFWGYVMCSPTEQTLLLQDTPPSSPLSSLLHHLERRTQAIVSPTPDLLHSQRELSIAPVLIRYQIDSVWKMYDPELGPSAGGDPVSWFVKALFTSGAPSTILQFFCPITTLHWKCADNHISMNEDRYEHIVLRIVVDNVKRLRRHLDKQEIGIDDYFTHYIPRRMHGVPVCAPFHSTDPPDCSTARCCAIFSLPTMHQISHHWPKLLFVTEDLLYPEHRVAMRPSFSIAQTDDGKPCESVTYDLYARILHHRSAQNTSRSNHFTMELCLSGGRTYRYDDNSDGGQLRKSVDPDLLLKSSPGTSVYAYVFIRTSTACTTVQTPSVIQRVFGSDLPEEPQKLSLDDEADESDLLLQKALFETMDVERKRRRSAKSKLRQLAADYSSTDDDNDDASLLHCADGGLAFVLGTVLSCMEEGRSDCEHRKEACGVAGDVVNNPDGSITIAPLSDETPIVCCICNDAFHLHCIIYELRTLGTDEDHLALIQTGILDDASFCCRPCITNGAWDRKRVGLFIMFKLPGWKHFYAAEIISLSKKDTVTLQWFKHNIYSRGDQAPKSASFKLSLRDCECALLRPYFRYTDATVGAVKYPIWLHPDATEKFGYRNTALYPALDKAVPFISDVLTGLERHPIMPIVNAYLDFEVGMATEDGKAVRPDLLQQRIANFRSNFFIPILPGDESMFPGFLAKIQDCFMADDKRGAISSVCPAELLLDVVQVIGSILLSVVTTRVYLSRPPSDDEQIFALGYLPDFLSHIQSPAVTLDSHLQAAQTGNLERRLTPYERARFAGCGADDLIGAARTMLIFTHRDLYPLERKKSKGQVAHLKYYKTLPSPSLQDFPIAVTQSGSDVYTFITTKQSVNTRGIQGLDGISTLFPASLTPASRGAHQTPNDPSGR